MKEVKELQAWDRILALPVERPSVARLMNSWKASTAASPHVSALRVKEAERLNEKADRLWKRYQRHLPLTGLLGFFLTMGAWHSAPEWGKFLLFMCLLMAVVSYVVLEKVKERYRDQARQAVEKGDRPNVYAFDRALQMLADAANLSKQTDLMDRSPEEIVALVDDVLTRKAHEINNCVFQSDSWVDDWLESDVMRERLDLQTSFWELIQACRDLGLIPDNMTDASKVYLRKALGVEIVN